MLAEGFKVNIDFNGFKNDKTMILEFGQTPIDYPVEVSFGIKN